MQIAVTFLVKNQQHIHAQCGSQMFQGMTADNAQQVIDFGIKMFKQFGNNVEQQQPPVGMDMCAVLTKTNHHDGYRQHGVELHECIEPQVACTPYFTQVPV